MVGLQNPCLQSVFRFVFESFVSVLFCCECVVLFVCLFCWLERACCFMKMPLKLAFSSVNLLM